MPRTRKLCKRRKPVPGDAVNALEPNYALKPVRLVLPLSFSSFCARTSQNVVSPQGVFCHLCGIMSTPQWRRGPDGRQSCVFPLSLSPSSLFRSPPFRCALGDPVRWKRR